MTAPLDVAQSLDSENQSADRACEHNQCSRRLVIRRGSRIPMVLPLVVTEEATLGRCRLEVNRRRIAGVEAFVKCGQHTQAPFGAMSAHRCALRSGVRPGARPLILWRVGGWPRGSSRPSGVCSDVMSGPCPEVSGWAPPLLGARSPVGRGALGRARSARLLFLYKQRNSSGVVRPSVVVSAVSANRVPIGGALDEWYSFSLGWCSTTTAGLVSA